MAPGNVPGSEASTVLNACKPPADDAMATTVSAGMGVRRDPDDILPLTGPSLWIGSTLAWVLPMVFHTTRCARSRAVLAVAAAARSAIVACACGLGRTRG